MKFAVNSTTCPLEVAVARYVWLQVKLFFSVKAREDMEAAQASLEYIRHLEEIKRVRAKAEEHATFIQEVKDGQPELIVMEGSLDEYKQIAADSEAAAKAAEEAEDTPPDDTPAPALGMKSVEWNPNVDEIDELYDNLEERITLEAAEFDQHLRNEGWGKK